MTWKTITIALALAGITTALVPRPAEALPANEVWRYYFSDAAMTNEVGEKFVTSCYGVVNQLTGSTGPYSYTVSESCSPNGGLGGGCYSHGVKINCPATICQQVPEFCD